MKSDFSQSYMKWKIKWKSLYWNERESDDRISFYDYCIDESNDGKFRSNKEDKDWEIPRLSLLSETIRSLDYLNEHHIIDREQRRKIEDFLLILTWYNDKKCGKNHFWQCLVEPSDGLSAVSSKAIKYLDEGVELKKVEMKINSRENAESAFGIMAIRSKVRRMISSGNYVTSSGRFSSASASKFLSGRILRCRNIVEEEIVRRISGIETEGRISHFEIDISRRQILRIAKMCGWEEPGTNVEDSVYKLLEKRRNTRLRENKRNKRRILQYYGLFGKIRTFDLAGIRPINSKSWLMILSSLIRGEDNNLNAKKQQQFNLGNIVFPNPVDWSEDTGRVLDTEPVYGHYRTDEYETVRDLKDEDVPAVSSEWYNDSKNAATPPFWQALYGKGTNAPFNSPSLHMIIKQAIKDIEDAPIIINKDNPVPIEGKKAATTALTISVLRAIVETELNNGTEGKSFPDSKVRRLIVGQAQNIKNEKESDAVESLKRINVPNDIEECWFKLSRRQVKLMAFELAKRKGIKMHFKQASGDVARSPLVFGERPDPDTEKKSLDWKEMLAR